LRGVQGSRSFDLRVTRFRSVQGSRSFDLRVTRFRGASMWGVAKTTAIQTKPDCSTKQTSQAESTLIQRVHPVVVQETEGNFL